MTFKTITLTLTLTSPIILDHIKISFHEYEPLQKYSRTLITLVFHADSKKAQNYTCDDKFTSLCTQ